MTGTNDVKMSLIEFFSLASEVGQMTKSYGGMYVSMGESMWWKYDPHGKLHPEPFATLTDAHKEAWEKMNEQD